MAFLQKTERSLKGIFDILLVFFFTYTCILQKWVFLIYSAEYKNDLFIFHDLKHLACHIIKERFVF